MKYAKEHGFPNPKFYVDDGYTGTNFDRPSFKEMSADIEKGLVKTVIVKDLSLFGRNYIEVGSYSGMRKGRETNTANRHLLFLYRDCGHPHGPGNAGNGTGIYAAYQTSNRLNTGVAGENLCSCRYISIFIPIWFNP
ncbi:recombinase family protein [Lachnospiraceae bacterium WCA-9-b2]|uniref:Recombinase family protein n=2 Tax=Sporofaciens musculi TaxID=2681861 RepID=A0A7X3MH78_9FIRM|nr:recombinase family protein [Sporofaciens musculi]